jgi:hypothetical protein
VNLNKIIRFQRFKFCGLSIVVLNPFRTAYKLMDGRDYVHSDSFIPLDLWLINWRNYTNLCLKLCSNKMTCFLLELSALLYCTSSFISTLDTTKYWSHSNRNFLTKREFQHFRCRQAAVARSDSSLAGWSHGVYFLVFFIQLQAAPELGLSAVGCNNHRAKKHICIFQKSSDCSCLLNSYFVRTGLWYITIRRFVHSFKAFYTVTKVTT